MCFYQSKLSVFCIELSATADPAFRLYCHFKFKVNLSVNEGTSYYQNLFEFRDKQADGYTTNKEAKLDKKCYRPWSMLLLTPHAHCTHATHFTWNAVRFTQNAAKCTRNEGSWFSHTLLETVHTVWIWFSIQISSFTINLSMHR